MEENETLHGNLYSNHQSSRLFFFKWFSCFQAHFQAQRAGGSNLSPQNNQSCHVRLALSPAEEGPNETCFSL